MMSQVKKPFASAICGIFLLVPYGCATHSLSLPPELRAQLGRIGVVSAQYTPELEFEGPGTGLLNRTSGAWEGLKSGAQEGAERGASITVDIWKQTGTDPRFKILGLFIGIVVGSVGTIVEGGVGMAKGMINTGRVSSLADSKTLRHTLDAYIKKLEMQERFRREVVMIVRQNTSHDITEFAQEGPTQHGSAVSNHSLKDESLDTILEVGVVSLGLKSTSAFHPEFSVFMVVKADLLRIEDEALLYRTTLTHTSQPLPYKEWADNNANAFQKALNKGYRNLAGQMVSTLF